jgi:hypothetical protein
MPIKKYCLKLSSGFLAALGLLSASGDVIVQDASNVVGSGDRAWSYLVVEGEDYDSKVAGDDVGFIRVDNTGAITSSQGNPILPKYTMASKKGALFTQTVFGEHVDKATYQVQFTKAGTYYLYMRFTMYENGGNLNHYINEDSFFVPPDFNKDPQTDWPLPKGGYIEGCCDLSGFLYIPDETGVRVNHTAEDDAGKAFWEGNFHWNQLITSQFNNPDTSGEPNVRIKYEVTEDMLDKPQNFTISYREGGVTIDLFLFSTNPDLLSDYRQDDLTRILLPDVPKVTVQDPSNVIGTGANAWSYLILEGEDFDFKENENPDVGFTRVDSTGSITSSQGNPILDHRTTASKKAALFTQTIFQEHADKVTYMVQFATPGTYYLYMRFTMFENGGNVTHYINEDSFFLPPDFDKDPQTDWPLPKGGYVEGCCDLSGFLYVPDGSEIRVNHTAEDDAGKAFWEGNFHWNQLITSQFNNPDTAGEPNVRIKYEVTEAEVGKPMPFTISYREGGVTMDLFLFSTNPDLVTTYKQSDLDRLLIPEVPQVTVQDPGNVVGTGADAWSYLILEGEDYDFKENDNLAVGFTRVSATSPLSDALGNPILGADTTASKKGALFTQTVFQEHADKVTYQVQFAKPGTYYLYMRFTMYENGGNFTHYINEDSFFVPPDFNKDPQTDWPLPKGGYVEGCCDLSGFLYVPDATGVRVNHTAEDDAGKAFWEGNFHWNQLITSQFNNPDTAGEPNLHIKYDVTADEVGKPLDFTISYREGGVTIDLFLFSTSPDLMSKYTQAQLDQVVFAVGGGSNPSLTVTHAAKNVTLSWPVSAAGFVLESSASLSTPAWAPVTDTPVVNGDQNSISADASTGTKFYRLRKS